jgi:hypothetical protein
MVLLLKNPIIRIFFLIVVSLVSHLSFVLSTIFITGFYIRNLSYFAYEGFYVTFNDNTHHLLFTFESLAVLPFSLLTYYFLNREIEESILIFKAYSSNNH